MKRVNGIELLEMLKCNEIKRGTKIHLLYKNEEFNPNEKVKFYTIVGQYRQLHLWRNDDGKIEDIRNIDTEDLLENDFYVEKSEDIKTLKLSPDDPITTICKKIEEKVNEIIQYVKDKE